MLRISFSIFLLLQGLFVRCENTSSLADLAASPTVQQQPLSNSPYVSQVAVNSNASVAIQPSASTTVQVQQTETAQTTQPVPTTMNPILADLHQKALDMLKNMKTDPPTEKPTTEPFCQTVQWGETKDPRSCNNDEGCLKKLVEDTAKLFTCMESKPANVSISKTFHTMESVGLAMVSGIYNKLESGQKMNTTVMRSFYETMALDAGVINGSVHKTGETLHVTFPDYNSNPDDFQGDWGSVRDSLSFPVSELPKGNFKYMIAIINDVTGRKALEEDEMDFKENIIAKSDISELSVEGDQLKTTRKRTDTRLNSRVISFTISALANVGTFNTPILITFKRLQMEGYKDPQCVYWDTRLSLWSRTGCSVKKANGTHTVCACNHMSTFAVAMKQENIDDYTDRQMVVTMAGVLGAISLLGLVCVAIFIIAIGCYHVESIKIILNLDAALILGHLVFFIGLSNKDSLFYADQDACAVVNGFVHFCQVAVFSWLLMEAVHLFSMFQPLINEDNTSSLMYYLALGWGIPAAFAGACAGYPYEHYGTPMRSEFCWMFINGSGAWYFAAPVFVLIMLNVVVRGLVLVKVLTWNGDALDDKLERAKRGLIFSSVLLFVVGMTWLTGVQAVNNTTSKANHYFFLLFYTLQGLLIFVFYCVKNKEMWEVYREKKEQKVKEENAVYHFVYIP